MNQTEGKRMFTCWLCMTRQYKRLSERITPKIVERCCICKVCACIGYLREGSSYE